MKKNYLSKVILRLTFFALLFSAHQLTAQSGACVMVEWSAHYGGNFDEGANDVIPTADGGFVAVGYSRSSNNMVTQNQGKADYWIIKVDSLGALQWEESYGGSENDIASSVVQTPDGGYLVAGGAVSFDVQVIGNHGSEDVWVLKLDAMGQLEWAKTYGGSLNERAESIAATMDGHYILAGYSQSFDHDVSDNNGDFDYWVLKIDIDGNLLWEKNFGGSLSDFGFDINPTSDGGYLMVGSTISQNGDVNDNNGFYDYWIVKMDADGKLLWERNYGGTQEERAYAIEVFPDDGAVITGTSNSSDGDVDSNNGNYDFWTIRINADGDLLWENSYGGISEDRAYDVVVLSDGTLLTAGVSSSNSGDVGNNFGSQDAWVVKLDAADGNLVWEKNLGGSKEDRLFAMAETLSGGYVGAGLSASDDIHLPANFGGRDMWLINLSPDTLAIDLGKDTTLCFNDNLVLQVEMDDISYLWSDGSTDPFLSVSESGEYWLEIDLFGCLARDTIQVDYLTETGVSLGNDTILCEGASLLLTFDIPGAAYEWRDGSVNDSFLVEVPGNYWVSIFKNGCEQKDTIAVDFVSVDIGFPGEAFICEGESLVLNVERPQSSYLWQDGTTNPQYTITGPGIYWVQLTQSGCSFGDTINVDFQDGPDSIFAAHQYICENEGIWFDASFPGANYTWQDGSTEPRFKAVAPGSYRVEVDINGCLFVEETTLKSCERCLFIPNVFSPNGDGINDDFLTAATCELIDYRALIFDRWGNIVFESFDPAFFWDGNYGGQKADIGTYTYLITYGLASNGRQKPQQRTGTLTLIR